MTLECASVVSRDVRVRVSGADAWRKRRLVADVEGRTIQAKERDDGRLECFWPVGLRQLAPCSRCS